MARHNSGLSETSKLVLEKAWERNTLLNILVMKPCRPGHCVFHQCLSIGTFEPHLWAEDFLPTTDAYTILHKS